MRAVSLRDLIEGRRQLIVYRSLLRARQCSAGPITPAAAARMVADQVAHVAHLERPRMIALLVFASRAPQPDIARLKARMGSEMPWFTVTDSFDADFGVDEWHGTNVFLRDGSPRVPHLLHQEPRRRADG